MSTIDQLKRDAAFEECSDEKRSKTEAVCALPGDLPDNVKGAGDVKSTGDVEPDPNDYRNYRIKEENVGITEFVSNNKGFKCELKQRYSDFIVHELAADGEITCVTSDEVPIIEENKEEAVEDAENGDLISSEQLAKVVALDERTELTDESILIDAQEKDKNQRTQLHRFLNRFSSLESRTEEIDGRKYIKVVKLQKGSSRRQKDNWPTGLPNYLHFNLYQENKGKILLLFWGV